MISITTKICFFASTGIDHVFVFRYITLLQHIDTDGGKERFTAMSFDSPVLPVCGNVSLAFWKSVKVALFNRFLIFHSDVLDLSIFGAASIYTCSPHRPKGGCTGKTRNNCYRFSSLEWVVGRRVAAPTLTLPLVNLPQ